MPEATKPPSRVGRRPSTTRGELSDLGIDLFATQGFEETSIEDIANAAGIARRTFFRYFPSKNAVPWGDFDVQLRALAEHLDSLPAGLGLADGLRSALLQFNTFPPEETVVHRQRMTLILRNPELQSYSMVMYEGWRKVIADFVAKSTGAKPSDHYPQTVGWIALGVAVSAYEQWLRVDSLDLAQLLTEGTRVLYSGIDGLTARDSATWGEQ